MEWQPIETAPRDGSAVLLYQKKPHAEVARYESDTNEIEVGFYSEEGWRVFGFHGDESERDFAPTHWMPLPQPPADNQKKG